MKGKEKGENLLRSAARSRHHSIFRAYRLYQQEIVHIFYANNLCLAPYTTNIEYLIASKS